MALQSARTSLDIIFSPDQKTFGAGLGPMGPHCAINITLVTRMPFLEVRMLRALTEDHERRSPDPEILKTHMGLSRSPRFPPWTQGQRVPRVPEKVALLCFSESDANVSKTG